MTARRAACLLAALVLPCANALAADSEGMLGTRSLGGLILRITINASNPRPVRPQGPIDNLRAFMAAFAGCWNPPPLDQSRQPLDLTFQVSFKRSGELFAKPRVIHFAREVTPEERQRYYQVVAEAIDLCSPMPFTETMGGAVAGRLFQVNFQDARNRKP